MIAGVSWVWWLGFHAVVVVLLLADSLLPGHKNDARHAQLFAWLWTVVLVLVSVSFALWLAFTAGRQTALEWIGGYAIETSLSVDNLFVFLVIFEGFRISRQRQHNALLWGVAGAVVLRGVFILAGITLLQRFGSPGSSGPSCCTRRFVWFVAIQPRPRFPSGSASCSRPRARCCR
jgi:tellurite resistance protein TerC